MTYYKSLTKKVLFTVLSVALLTLFSQSVQADPVLRGYWTFDTDTVDSGKAVESSGYEATNHDATLVGGTNISFNSIEGEAGNHLDSGNYIQFTNSSYAYVNNSTDSCYDFNGGSYTISAWVKGTPGTWCPYVAKNGESYGYQLRRQGSNSYPTFTIRLTGGDDDPAPNITGADTDITDNEWHNLIAVYGGTYRELYMDGNLILRMNDTATNSGGTGEQLTFNARNRNGGYDGQSNISLDNIAIYSGALRDNQISYINNGGDPTKLAAVQAETVSISMSEKASGKLVKTSFVGKTSHSWLEGETSFEGGYLTTNLPTGSAGLNGSFTASAWVKLDSTSGDQPIFGNQSAPGNNSALHLIVRNGEPHMGFYGNDTTASGTKLSTDEWYYLTFQYDADNKTQKIYLNGKEIASNTNKSAFAGNNFLEIGAIYSSSTSKTTLDGSLKGVSVTDGVLTADQITAMMNATTTTRVEDFSTGKNTAEWCGGCGATFGNAYNDYNGKSCLMTYWKPYDGTTSNIYGDGDSDNKTGAIWGPQFTVADSLPDDAKISFSYAGSSTKLQDTGHVSGGVGVALWDIDEGDFVRDSSGNILSYTGNNSATWFDGSFSLKGLEGHNLMLTMVDRQTGSYGWIAITDVTADTTQISSLSSAAQHSLVLNSYNFDTEGSFDGMYEIDSAGNKLDEITHFTNGSRQGSAVTNFYIDQSGSFSAGKKGFLSSGTAAYGEEQTTGILRSDNFLVQGDVLEFYIAGGNNIALKHIDLVDADTEEVYFSTTGDQSNDFHYDMWNLKDIQGKSVYIKIVDADGGTGWSHLEIDQIQQTKFARLPRWLVPLPINRPIPRRLNSIPVFRA